jgi:hypothetical protein
MTRIINLAQTAAITAGFASIPFVMMACSWT